MRKIIIFILTLSMLICLCACRQEQLNNNLGNASVINASDLEKYTFDTVLYQSSTEDIPVINDTKSIDFGSSVFIDSSAKQKFSVNILNERFTAEYTESAKLPLTADIVHTYTLKNTGGKIMVSAKTGKIVEYINIPIKISYSTEKEYIDFISNFIGKSIDLTAYEYKCTTWHYLHYEDGFESKVEDGFHICSGNEKFSSYSFYFDKTLGGIKTLDHVSAEFFEDSFYLEVYDMGYESGHFAQLLQNLGSSNEVFDSYLDQNFKNDYVLNSYAVSSQTLFIRDGIPYIQTTLDIDFGHDEKDTFGTVIKIITGYFAQE